MFVNALRHFQGPLTVFALPVEPLATTFLGCLADFNFANASEDAPNNITKTKANLSIRELHLENFSFRHSKWHCQYCQSFVVSFFNSVAQ